MKNKKGQPGRRGPRNDLKRTVLFRKGKKNIRKKKSLKSQGTNALMSQKRGETVKKGGPQDCGTSKHKQKGTEKTGWNNSPSCKNRPMRGGHRLRAKGVPKKKKPLVHAKKRVDRESVGGKGTR